jgi:hypothetical protein
MTFTFSANTGYNVGVQCDSTASGVVGIKSVSSGNAMEDTYAMGVASIGSLANGTNMGSLYTIGGGTYPTAPTNPSTFNEGVSIGASRTPLIYLKAA